MPYSNTAGRTVADLDRSLKAPDDKFPAATIRAAGYGAVWQGQKSWNGVAILARSAEPSETRRGLPGDPDDPHSRYIEAVIGGTIVGCLCLPNGNPAPGPKFDYKLRRFERLSGYSKTLWDSGAPVVLAGDFNVMPTCRSCGRKGRAVVSIKGIARRVTGWCL
jgi:exodeoxyribonuclease-3